MRNLVVIIAVMALVILFAVSCKKQPPVVNGENVLTVAQYNQLIGKIKADIEKSTATSESEQKSDLFAEGSRLYREEMYAKAAASFGEVVKQSPENSRAWFMLGSCQEKLGNLQEAQQSYKNSYDIMVKQGYIADSKAVM